MAERTEFKGGFIVGAVTTGLSMLCIGGFILSRILGDGQADDPNARRFVCSAYATVPPGGYLGSLAMHYRLTPEEIAAANGLKNPNLIHPDVPYCIPATVTPAPTATSTS